MMVFVLQLIFLAISALSSIVSRLIFTAAAHLLVLIIQGFKLPGQAVQGALEQVADVIRSCFEYFLQLIMEVMGSVMSTAFDLLIEAIKGSVTLTGSAIGGQAEQARTSVDGWLKDTLSQISQDFSEMISNVMTNLWNNYKDAVGYVTGNA